MSESHSVMSDSLRSHGILQARILEWVAVPFSSGSSQPRDQTCSKPGFEWEKIKNHISGVWNSSDIGLDLGKLQNQIQTLEHSQLDFTAAGAVNDFFHTFSNFISGKNILSNLLIIILPCIVRILRQNIQKLASE